MKHFLESLGFYSFKVFEFFLFLLPKKIRKKLFILLAQFAYKIDDKHRRVVLQNLNATFGDTLTQDEKESISYYCYKNMLLALLQVMENQRLSHEELAKKVTFKNREVVDKYLQDNKPIVFVSAHLSNWEVGAPALASHITPLHAVHKALNHKLFDKYLLQARSRFHLTMVEKHGAIKRLNKALKSGGSVSLLIDQNIKNEESVVVKFFGIDVNQTPAPAFLAKRLHAPIIPVSMSSEDDENFTVTFYDEIFVKNSDDKNRDILEATQAQAAWLESVIKEEPKYWFWCHRRFKGRAPEVYKKEV